MTLASPLRSPGISSGQGGDSEHWSDAEAVSNLGRDIWVPHLGGLAASSGWHGCLERKRTKILNESPVTEFGADPYDIWNDSVHHGIAASDRGKKFVLYFLAGQIGLVWKLGKLL